jgi:hypothetical protein
MSDEELLRHFGLKRIRPIPEPVYACPKCKDAPGGWITIPDGGAGRAERCDCQTNPPDAVVDQRLAEIGMRTAEVDGSKAPWRTIVAGVEVDAPSPEVGAWFKSIAEPKPARPLLLLYGPPGRGKSKLAATLARRWVKENFLRRAMWAYWSAALRMDRRDAESDIEDRMCTADFLVLDDATKGLSGYGLDVLERVIDERQGEYLPTSVTMNLAPGLAGADEVLRATLASRLQRAVIEEFVGQLDIRGAL